MHHESPKFSRSLDLQHFAFDAEWLRPLTGKNRTQALGAVHYQNDDDIQIVEPTVNAPTSLSW
jgi:hypothetical protein